MSMLTEEEITKHNSADSCWITIDNNVYDVTAFLADHPGGADLILKWAGKDATKAFDNADHSEEALEMTDEYKIGQVGGVMSSEPNNNEKRSLTRTEVAKHNTEESCWIILDGNVYDVTAFLNDHPGGGDLILKWAGEDATKAFDNAEHSDEAIEMLDEYKIGQLSNDDYAPNGSKYYTRTEVAKHNTEEDCWIILDNNVYDVTKFLNDHPGGGDLILKWAGQDGTQAFENAEHSDEGIEMTAEYKVGEISPNDKPKSKKKIKTTETDCCVVAPVKRLLFKLRKK